MKQRLTHITLLLCFISGLLCSQTDQVDSLIQLLSKQKDDTNKLRTLNLIAELADEGVWQRYNNEQGKLASKLQNSKDPQINKAAKRYLAASLNNTGFNNFQTGNLRAALNYFQKSLTLQKSIFDSIGIAQSLNNVAAVYDSQGDVLKALQYYFESLNIRELISDKKGMSQSLNNIAVLYSNQSDFKSTLQFHEKCLKIKLDLKDSVGIARTYNNIGTTKMKQLEALIKQEKYISTESLQNIYKDFYSALKINNKIKNEDGLATTYINIGMYHELLGIVQERNGVSATDTTYEKAERYIKNALNYFINSRDKEWEGNTWNALAQVNIRANKIKEAEVNANKAYQIGVAFQFPFIIQNAAETLVKVYRAKKDYAKALEMSDLANSLKDSLMSENIKKESVSKKFIYENEKKDAIVKTNIEKAEYTYKTKEREQRIILIVVLVITLLILFFGLVIYNRLKVTRKQKAVIELKEIETQHQKQIIEEKQKEILDSIHYAKRIQNALLVQTEFIDQNIENNFILFKPKDIVSGDFYWATKHNNVFYLAVCDSTGHGVPGAFMSLLNIGFLSEAINEKNITQPNEIFDYVRKRLITSISKEGQKEGFDGILMCYNEQTKKVTYSAAHNSPVIIRNSEVISCPCDKMPVGQAENLTPFQLFDLDLHENDTLYLYTDGYADQFGGPKGKKFMYKKLNNLLITLNQKPLKEQQHNLANTFEEWKGSLEQVDDVLIIGLKLT
ncbi:MAG: tetratricopeptide repeat protein [Sphingobacteriaceae bacterium]